MKAVFKKELRAFFCGAKGYLFVAINLFFTGALAYLYNFYSQSSHVELAVSLLTLVTALTLPIVTSSIFSKEKNKETDKLLFALPLSSGSIVFGKFLAVIALTAPIIAVLVILPIIYGAFVTVNFAMAFTSILGYLLFVFAISAIFTFI